MIFMESTLKNLRLSKVKDITALSETTIWRLEQAGQFPKRRKISKRAVAWSAAEVYEWLENKHKEHAGAK